MQLDSNQKIIDLEKCFGIKIKNKQNFIKSLTHTSYTGENEIDVKESYERMEFLGDAVLKLCVSDILFKKYPELPEGDLTKLRSNLVSDNTLARIGEKIGLNKLVILGKQEEKTGGRKKLSIVACAFEALLGAFYLDDSYKKIFAFLEKVFTPEIENLNENLDKINAKATLQEHTQSLNKNLPKYEIKEEKGPEHNKIFVVQVSYMDEVLAIGQGKTKKEAEQDGAMQACKKMGIIK